MFTSKRTRTLTIFVYALVGVVVLSACGNLRNQPSYRAYEASEIFGNSAWVTDENAVADGMLEADEHLYNGTIDGSLADTFPFEITEEILLEGERWYEGFCAPCHGYSGYGDGVVRIEGYPVQPLNFHADGARNAPVGATFQVISNGSNSGLMWPLANRIPAEERWAIVAYIRALQISQNASGDLPAGLGGDAADTAEDAEAADADTEDADTEAADAESDAESSDTTDAEDDTEAETEGED